MTMVIEYVKSLAYSSETKPMNKGFQIFENKHNIFVETYKIQKNIPK